MISEDALNWELKSAGSDDSYIAIASGNGIFCSVAIDGANGRVMTSGFQEEIIPFDNGYNLGNPMPVYNSETTLTQGIGTGIFYNFGFYESSSTDETLTQSSPTLEYADTNCCHQAHAFIVASGAGTASGGTGTVEVEVSGTSYTDDGIRTANDTEIILVDITTMSTDVYAETDKKWIGAITYTIQNSTGSTHTSFSFTFNYGLSAYNDFGNRNFTVTDIILNGFVGANDSDWKVELLHHKSTGWTYASTGFIPGNGAIADTDSLAPENNLVSGNQFRWKRSGLSTPVNGGGSEGILLRTTTGSINSIESQSVNIGVVLTS
jgi:hypothetical protein